MLVGDGLGPEYSQDSSKVLGVKGVEKNVYLSSNMLKPDRTYK